MITIDKEITPSLKSRLSKIKHLALDMDGTIYLGSTLFPFTLDFLSSMKENGGALFLPHQQSHQVRRGLSEEAGGYGHQG